MLLKRGGISKKTSGKCHHCCAQSKVDNKGINVTLSFQISCLMNFTGAPTRTRTADLLITNQLLYQLSYRGTRGPHNWIAGFLQDEKCRDLTHLNSAALAACPVHWARGATESGFDWQRSTR